MRFLALLFWSIEEVNLLIIIVFLLALGTFLSSFYLEEEDVQIAVCLIFSFLALFVGLYCCVFFNQGVLGYQFIYTAALNPLFGASYILGVDGISLVFLILTLFIFPFCFLAAQSVALKGRKQFCTYLISIELLLVLTFTTIDLFYFYVFFESLLIPIFILIGV